MKNVTKTMIAGVAAGLAIAAIPGITPVEAKGLQGQDDQNRDPLRPRRYV